VENSLIPPVAGRPVKGVSFDLWLTLLRVAPEARQARVAALASAFGVAPTEAFAEITDQASRELDRLSAATGVDYDCGSRIDLIADKIGLARLSEDARRAAAEACQAATLAYPPSLIEADAPGTIDRLAARGIKIATISNTGFSSGKTVRVALEKLGLARHITATIFSDEIGHAKPHAAIFEAAREALGLAPEEILHVGDSEEADVAGARAAGFRSAHFQFGCEPAEGAIGSITALTR
jgi:putative hydrolase of the HAD superfamily